MIKDIPYWIEAWNKSNNFRVENDRLKKKSYLFSSIPTTNFCGFQDGNLRPLLVGDFFSRYQRMNDYNVLFPTGLNMVGKMVHEEDKKYKNNELAKIYQSQMEELGIGIDHKHFIKLNQDEYIGLLQLAFIDLYERGYIKYDYISTVYDRNRKEILDYYFQNGSFDIKPTKAFYLDISSIQNDVLMKIDSLNISDLAKKSLYQMLDPQKSIVINFMVTNGTKLKIQLKEPQYMGGISFIMLHPDYIDFSMYTSPQEFSAIERYLSEDNLNDFGVFSGNYATNPLTGKKIPIYISVQFDCPIYIANPFINEIDRKLALEEGLPVTDVVQNGVFIESDFLNGVQEALGKSLLIDNFLEADMCEIENYYRKDKILLSSLDMYGILYPFLIDENQNLHPLKRNLPFTLSSKIKVSLSDQSNVVVNKIDGSFGVTFTRGMLPILSLLYDEIGGSVSIFSKVALDTYIKWNGIDILTISKDEIFDYLFFPLCIISIIEKEKEVFLPPYVHKLLIIGSTLDEKGEEINRSNNNLFDIKSYLKQSIVDALRFYFLSQPLNDAFHFKRDELGKYQQLVKKIEQTYQSGFVPNNALDLDFKTFTYDMGILLEEKKVVDYVQMLIDFYLSTISENKLTSNQGLILLKLIYPIAPFLAEDLYLQKFKGKYLLSSIGWFS